MHTSYIVDTEILKGFKEINGDILVYVYEKHYPAIKNYILQNSGTYDDAHDVFKEAMRIVFNKVQHEELCLSDSFQSFFHSIIKNKWNERISGNIVKLERPVVETDDLCVSNKILFGGLSGWTRELVGF